MDRNYAYISITGTGNTADVSTALGLMPTEQWNVGDLRRNNTRYDFARWAFESPDFEKGLLDEAIAAVVRFIEEKQLDLTRLPADFEASIQCVGHHEHESPGFHLDRDLVRKLGRLGVAIDFDLYCYAGPDTDA